MKSMDFFARLGAYPQPHWRCGEDMQRRMAEKDTISCIDFGETNYLAWVADLDRSIIGPQARN